MVNNVKAPIPKNIVSVALWYLMVLLATGSAMYALMNVALPSMRPKFVVGIFESSPIAAYLHIGFGFIAMLIGPYQLHKSLRKKFVNWHRQLGFLYITSVALSSTSGFLLATESYGGLVTHVGFSLMASLWFFTTAMAFYHIRKGNAESHGKWMYRSYALTLAGVTLRVYLGISVLVGIPFHEIYPVLAWLSWVPNLLVVDWLILRKRQ